MEDSQVQLRYSFFRMPCVGSGVELTHIIFFPPLSSLLSGDE